MSSKSPVSHLSSMPWEMVSFEVSLWQHPVQAGFLTQCHEGLGREGLKKFPVQVAQIRENTQMRRKPFMIKTGKLLRIIECMINN